MNRRTSDVNSSTSDVVDGAAERQEATPVGEDEVVREQENSPDQTATDENRSDADDGEEDRSDNDEDDATENIKEDVTKRIGDADDGSDSSSGEYDISKDASTSSEKQTSPERVDHLDGEASRTDLGYKASGEGAVCEAGEDKFSDNVIDADLLLGGGDTKTYDTSILIGGNKSNQVFCDENSGVVIEDNAFKMENGGNLPPDKEEPLIVDPLRPVDKDCSFSPSQENTREDQSREAPSVRQEPVGQPHQVSSTPLPHISGEEKVGGHGLPLPSP